MFARAYFPRLIENSQSNTVLNYRPISLLSTVSKILEIFLKGMKFFVKNKLLANNHIVFESKMSCVHAVATIAKYIRTVIGKKSTGQASFIDLSKAFIIDNKIHTVYELRVIELEIRISATIYIIPQS